ncbi:MAG: hypothetical protein LAT55_07180 [Opitutales bacterium]|nr:hypothetical protein [Opitutales bacterium]
MNKTLPLCSLIALFLGVTLLDLSANRFREYTDRYEYPNRPATPLTASYLGGEGDNYLIAGDFLPDGTLFLAGNAFGPSFSLRGTSLTVLGEDTPAPDYTLPTRDGRPRAPEAWKHRDGAAFITRLGPDYQEITKAIRFPWGAGVITDLVTDPQGNLYVTGTVGANFASLGSFRETGADGLKDDGKIFFGKLKTDLSGFDWLLQLPDATDNTPQLRYIGDGTVSLVGENGFHFNENGELLKAINLGLTNAWTRAICFNTFARMSGHFHRSNTGWEPWHRPLTVIADPDGERRFLFYQWDARTVGTNWSRLVSDSRMEVGLFDLDGQPIIGGWSDGGNSVWTRVPYDITRNARSAAKENAGRDTGLPFSTWGANIGSFLHLNRLDFETGNPLSYTLFIAYLSSRNAPSSVSLRNLDITVDNELFLSGASAYGLIQTRSLVLNTLDYEEDYIGRDFFAILDEDWSDIRFSSAVPGSRQVALERHSNEREGSFRFGSAHVDGKTMAVAVTGARQHDQFKPVNPIAEFGDGLLDGMFVVLEMERSERLPEPTFQYPTSSSQSVQDPRNDEDLTGMYMVNKSGMRNSDSMLVMKDTSGKKWPKLYRGNPVGENLVNATGRGSFTLRGEHDRVQLRGQGDHIHSMRLGGHNVAETDEYPTLELEITFHSQTEAQGVIRYQGNEISVQGPSGFRESSPVGRGIQMSGHFRTTKGDLGLAEDPSENEEEIIIQWWAPGRPAPDDVQEGAQAPSRDDSSPANDDTEDTEQARTTTTSSALASARTWTNQEGQEVRATFTGIENSSVVLVMENNREARVPLSNLSEEDRNLILKEKNLRVWTSRDGREMIARKVRADEDKVVIETPAGQVFEVALANLSEADQRFVKE